jgi:hypothetical protein
MKRGFRDDEPIAGLKVERRGQLSLYPGTSSLQEFGWGREGSAVTRWRGAVSRITSWSDQIHKCKTRR